MSLASWPLTIAPVSEEERIYRERGRAYSQAFPWHPDVNATREEESERARAYLNRRREYALGVRRGA